MLTTHTVCADREAKDTVRKAVGTIHKKVIKLKELDYEPRGWSCDCRMIVAGNMGEI